jgi:hypothetical protein
VPLERPPGVTTPFYTDKEVADLDNERSQGSVFGNHIRAERGSEADVNGAYNSVFTSQRPTGRRTSMNGTTPSAWTTIPAATIQKPITISGLTPTTIYGFQVQALGVLGYSDWSSIKTIICI